MKKLFYFLPSLLLTCFTGKSDPLINAAPASEQIRMNLYGFYPDSSTYTLDGTLTRYSDSYSNDIDINDSRKLYNSGENISMVRDGYDLIVECRHTINLTDTIFFRMWGMQKKSYRLEFVARNLDHPGLQAYLQDNYLKTQTPVQLNDTTRFRININNDEASYAQDRFRIIFYTPSTAIPPVPHFSSFNANPLNSNIVITWNTLNQNNTSNYFIERSADGIHFTDVGSVSSNPSGIYDWTDRYPFDQINYYRIREIEISGTANNSAVLKVKSEVAGDISLYPNPASAANLNLSFNRQEPGDYRIMLLSPDGHVVFSENYSYPGGMSLKKLSINRPVPPGVYRIEVTKDNSVTKVIGVVLH